MDDVLDSQAQGSPRPGPDVRKLFDQEVSNESAFKMIQPFLEEVHGVTVEMRSVQDDVARIDHALGQIDTRFGAVESEMGVQRVDCSDIEALFESGVRARR